MNKHGLNEGMQEMGGRANYKNEYEKGYLEGIKYLGKEVVFKLDLKRKARFP